MKVKWLLLLSFSWIMNLYSQNLIPDPGFEDIIECPKLYEFNKLRHWRQASSYETNADNVTQYGLLYHKCGGRVPNTDWGYYDTHSGNGMGSIVAYFIYTKLKEPLVKDKSYRISFWIRIGAKEDFACLWRTYSDKLSLFTYKNQPRDTIVGPIRQNPVYTWNITDTYDSSWVHFEGCFKAPDNDTYIGIGHKNTLLDLVCDEFNVIAQIRPNFLNFNREFAFRQIPFFIDDVELEISEEISLPKVDMTASYCPDTSTLLDATQFLDRNKNENRHKFLWNTGAITPHLEATHAGNYSVTIKDVCRTSKLNFTVKKKDCYCNIFLPNVFSPNGDNVNDVFKPNFACVDAKLSNYVFKIYGRWGNPIFESHDMSAGWDGTFKGSKTDTGVYVWTLSYDIKIGKKTENFAEFGDVTIP
jgi:gliding motility-associated-like protein